MKKININDVAREAGVSKATVSNVINNKGRFSEKTKSKVMDTVKKMGFEVNILAKNLSEGKSNIIGVIVPVYKGEGFFKDNLYFQEFISGINHYFTMEQHSKYDLIYTGVDVENESCKSWIEKRNLEGVIVIGMVTDNFYKELKETGVPALIMDIDTGKKDEFYHIHVADEKGGYLATKHLLENGHRNIAFVGSNPELSDVDNRRLIGYKKALKEYNQEFDEECIIAEPICLTGGADAADKLKEKSSKITGAFVTSDIVAIGMINRFKELGIDIPKDFSLVGFDNLSVSKLISPKLTTIDQNIYKKGSLAGKIIIDIIEMNGNNKKKVIQDVQLIERESVKKL